MSRTTRIAAAVTGLGLALAPLTVAPAEAAAAKKYVNCTAMNKVYKHGVAKKGARDRVAGRTRPVTNFYVNSTVYLLNRHLDRDKDGVACEKR